jgi:hypothetical protein
MSDRLLVGTHKGLFEFDWDDRAPLAMDSSRTHFLGEPVTMTLEDPRDGTLYAALNLGHFGVKLHRRLAGSRDWEECAVPVYPLQPAHNGTTENGSGEAQAERPDATTVPSWTLEQIWSLEAGGPDEPGVLWAGTIPGGLFCSNDGGETWTLNRPLWDRPERSEWMGGGYDHPGIHSVIVDPRDSRHVTVGVSTGGVWQTYDGGASWRLTALGMQADYMPPKRREDPNVQDPHRVVHCPAQPDTLWAQHHCAIFRSTDAGETWQRIEAHPSNFGFAVAVDPRDAETAWFVPAVKDACRVPVDARFVVTRTRDGGRSFDTLSDGLPSNPAYDLVYRHGLAVDATGSRLAMGSTTGGLWTSVDGGESWLQSAVRLPPISCVRFA